MSDKCKFLSLALAAAALLRGQEPLNPPVPLAPAPAASSPGMTVLSQVAAERAQELGFPAAAAGLYRELLAAPRESSAGLTLALATALIDDGRPDEAERTLAGWAGPRGAAWHLRQGLAEAGLRKNDAAKAELAAVKADELTPADRPWYFFLQGMLVGATGDPVKAGDFYQQAERTATTDLERARFLLAQEQARLRVGAVTQPMADQTRLNSVRFQGTATGYDFARSYAVMLDALGSKSEAVTAIQNTLLILPPQERARVDDFRLLLGLIAGAADGAGRNALVQLLETGGDPDRQREALQLLATASVRVPARAQFRAELDKLIAPSAPHPILEDLLLFRANWALGDKDYAQAEDDAHALLEKFPGSPLKTYALCVLTGSAWEQRRYRTAADDASQAGAASAAGEARAELGVVAAESWFRAGDFRSAAEAYAAALRDPPEAVRPGNLMFQRVEAQIEEGALDDAQQTLDGLARDPAFDITNRWEAEWNLARALQLKGNTRAAYDRVSRLLAGSTQGLTAELRVRMAWLQARLSLDANEPPERTLALVDALEASLDGLPAPLHDEIASTGALLKAQANFALKRDAAALAILKKLRGDFPKADAAVYSYIIEADHYAEQDRIVEAQQLLTQLAEDSPKSDYAPYALFQAALQAERLGQKTNWEEGDKLIESLVTKYPDSPLVFDARLKQGDLLRKLNDFPKAQQVYESLRNNFPHNPDDVYAELALAECHNAQSFNDSSHAESAISLFAELRDRVDAPLDVRVEAGFNLGELYERRGGPGDLVQAQDVWWRDVVSAFLLDPARTAGIGAKGRYWMTRTLIELGELYEKQGKLDDAKKAWNLVLTSRLPGATLAQEQLARFSAPAPKP